MASTWARSSACACDRRAVSRCMRAVSCCAPSWRCVMPASCSAMSCRLSPICSRIACAWRMRVSCCINSACAEETRSCSRATAISSWCRRLNISPRRRFSSARDCSISSRLLRMAAICSSFCAMRCSCSPISRSRESRLVMRDCELPPVIEPPECITSPSSVTRRKACRPRRMIWMPASRFSAMTVRPSRFSTTPRYFSSNEISSDATPRQPGVESAWRSAGVSTRPCTLVSGRNVARPNRLRRR